MEPDATEELPAALTKVEREATQPTADRLVSYAQMMTTLGRLSKSARVHVEVLGESEGKRAIPVVAITNDATPARLLDIQTTAARLAAADIVHARINEPVVVAPQLDVIPDDARIPILIQSSNFGSEAAQLQALLELITLLATDDSEPVRSALDHLVVLVVPLINPDGYETARAQWSRRPISPARNALGNHFGIEVTREYMHLIEPETQALARVVSQWHPFLVWEVHEDGMGLGWSHPEVCLAPPMTQFAKPGIDSAIAPSVDDPRIYAEHQRYGEAIAKAWAARGYNYLHESHGLHGWPRFSVPGDDGLVPTPEARFTQTMPLRGVPAFITESGRVPGSQTWEDRVEQKVSAGLAIVETAAAAYRSLVDIVADVQRNAVAGSDDFFLIPIEQDPFNLGRAVEILLGHGIRVYSAAVDGLGSAVVVPSAQPLRATVEQLLLFDRGKHLSLVATLGLRVRPSAVLPPGERSAWTVAALEPVLDASALIPLVDLGRGDTTSKPTYHLVANTHHGVRLATRLMNAAGAEVRWLARSGDPGGGFVVALRGRDENGGEHTRGLRLAVTAASAAQFEDATPLRLPRVGVWSAQGVHENTYNGTLIRWFLTEWGIPFRLLGPDDLTKLQLADLDAVIFPSGSAEAMLTGHEPGSRWHRNPWQFDEDPIQLDEANLDALREWIRAGGTYIGVDAGGGLLASQSYLGLIDADVASSSHGTGLVEVLLDQPADPLFDGLRGSWDGVGNWRDGVIYAMYVSNPLTGHDGGCGFVVGPGADRLAGLGQSLPITGVPHMTTIGNQDSGEPYAAVARADMGAGTVIVLGIEATYRCMYIQSARILSNAILASVVDRQAQVNE